jgi:hypothetical protein
MAVTRQVATGATQNPAYRPAECDGEARLGNVLGLRQFLAVKKLWLN